MKQNLYSIFDNVAVLFAPPFMLPNDATALRTFVALATDPDSRVSQNPGDYDLYRLASYDEETGEIQVANRPALVKEGRFSIAPKE